MIDWEEVIKAESTEELKENKEPEEKCRALCPEDISHRAARSPALLR